MYPRYQSRAGYFNQDNQTDGYGVDHSGFNLRDELLYQTARNKREQELFENYERQGLDKDCPRLGTSFWGKPANNYGFGRSNIENNIKKRQFTPILNAGIQNTVQGQTMMTDIEDDHINANNNDVSESDFNEFTNKFNELKYMTDIPHSISTGNKFVDKKIAKYGAQILGTLIKDPKIRFVVKAAEKIYPYAEEGGANIARVKAAYDETFNKNRYYSEE